MLNWRREIRYEWIVWPLALYAATVLNIPFWRRLVAGVEPTTASDYALLGVVFVDLVIILALLFGAFAYRWVFKPVAAALLVAMAAASYYMIEFGVVFDRDMIRNIFETDVAEASDLVNLKFIAFTALLGGVPALALAVVRIAPRPFWQELRLRSIATVASLAIMMVLTYPVLGSLMSVLRESAVIRYEVSPINLISGAGGYAGQMLATKTATAAQSDASNRVSARRDASWSKRARKTVLVVVLGETARSQNFSLNGYGRPTNPELASIADVVSFTATYSCGTATAASVPCMFSGLGREGYTPARGATEGNLIDHLRVAGFAQFWRDNQSGCKGVCRGIAFESLVPRGALSEKHISYDERLLDGVEPWVQGLDGPGVLYLHMMGSHGPAYFRRYPEDQAPFKPDCRDTRFSHCTGEELVNAYDNTIAYTDKFLASLIRRLAALGDDHGTAMLYLSDHGESLGEGNVYLHGMPYALAPETQRKVPFIFWANARFKSDVGLDMGCLGETRNAPLSHDHFFHSVLGLLGVESRRYSKDLDAFRACRRTAGGSG